MELFFSMQIHGIWLIVRKRTNEQLFHECVLDIRMLDSQQGA